MKKSLILASCAAITFGLAGCGANNNAANDNNDNGQQRVQTSQVDRGPAADEGGRLLLADRAERQVEQMPEVDDARVVISGNTAYVAVRLAGNGNNAGAGNNMDNNGNADVNDALDGNGRTFAENGRVDQDDNRGGNNGIIDGKGDAGNDDRRGDARNGNRQNADTQDGGYSNNIFGTGNGNGTDAGNGLESEIEQQVRRANRGIDNVYVSVDNNAFDRMGTFTDDIRNNRNMDGMFENFRDTMGNFFGR